MANPLFVVEGIGPSGPVAVEVRAISPEVALLRGREQLRDTHGKVRKVTARYAASAVTYTSADFTDPNRSPGDGSED